MNVLITGAGGLIGSEAVDFYSRLGNNVYGIENNQREIFFGKKGTVNIRLNQLLTEHKSFKNFNIDIRDKNAYEKIFQLFKPEVVIHTAGINSPDYVETNRELARDVNIGGLSNILE